MKWLLLVLMLPIVAIAVPSPDTVAKSKLTTSDWQYILQKVAAGDSAWLDAIPGLAAKVNREQANQLEEALAKALPVNTKGVLSTLRLLDAGSYPEMGGTDIVCVQEVAKPKPDEAYYNNTRLALLDDPNGAKCLWNLEGIWEEAKQAKK